jgi:hypothetical protein
MLGLQLQVKIRYIALAVAVTGLAAGRASSNKAGATAAGKIHNDWYAVVASHTPFYRHGPQQASGPDSQLPKDSIMKVIRPSFGYVKVQLQDGQSGYVANEDIGPATPDVVTEKLAPPPVPEAVVASHTSAPEEQFRLDSNDPRLIAPPEPLPASSPAPAFRY